MKNDEIVCYCSNVTKGQIVEALENGAKNLKDIRRMTGACTVGRCKELSHGSFTPTDGLPEPPSLPAADWIPLGL